MPDSTEEVPESTKEVPTRTHATPPVRIEPQGLSRWAAPAALIIAVIAVALALWALISASSKAPETALAGDPKVRVCTAFGTVSQAIPLQTNMDLGPDKVAQNAVAANARLSLIGGSQYLLNRLDSATPSQLSDPVRLFANSLQEIGMNALAGAPNSEPNQAARLAEADAIRRQIVELCK
jgi:hypothetical protein